MAEELKIFPSGRDNKEKNFFKIPAYVKATLGDAALSSTHVKKNGTLFSPQIAKLSKKLEKAFVYGTAKDKVEPYISFAKYIMKKTQKEHDVSKENKPQQIKIDMTRGGR